MLLNPLQLRMEHYLYPLYIFMSMRQGNFFVSLLFLILLSLISSCGDDFGSKNGEGFDREELLQNIGSNIIIPSYERYETSIINLKQRSNEFSQAPNSQTLQTLRNQFVESYLLWQYCNFYDFGPAVDMLLKETTNSFPANVQNIESNMVSGNYDLSIESNQSSTGFPAIDYLIFGQNKSDNDIIIQFFDNPSKRNYLLDVVSQMEDKIESVVELWSPNGSNYVESFVAKSGTDATSSLYLLIQAFNEHMEFGIRNAKIGIPLGVLSTGQPKPESVEAYFSQTSIPYIMESIHAMQLLFQGNDQDIPGIGIDDWLDALNANYEDRPLSNVIVEQFESSFVSISEIQDPFSTSVVEAPEEAVEAYTQLQVLLDLLKTNMTSSLEIAIPN